ncbi:MBL fold metallo-hydrolase [Pseudonocardia humida]|uniref:MBL fold metallo-hydrolase n=1 Tax=Pseudonocardia humida TaxID=2800819 RepID=UPI00207C2702|nr:MBL fold metallo-hydrolase [Pseudonocardia humida]
MDLPASLQRIVLPFGQCYAWRDGDEVTLVDTGPPGSGEAVAAALGGLGLDRDAVVRIVLTHHHPDHSGSAAEIRGWNGAELVAHAAETAVVRGEAAPPPLDLLPAEQQLWAQLGVDDSVPPPPCPVDREVTGGEVLPFGGGATVVHGPGHTPGSIALHLPGPRVLFTGDTVAESQGAVILGPFNLDRQQALAAFRRLISFDVDVALFGHGEPASGPELRAAVPGPFAG